MAGGAGWKLISKSDSADFYQKVEGGPWYMRKGISIVIRTKVQGQNVDLGPGDQGEEDGSITCIAGDTEKTRTKIGGASFVCKSDSLEDLGEGHSYMNRTQEWVWQSSEEEEVFSAP